MKNDSRTSSLSPHVVTGFLCGASPRRRRLWGEKETVRRALEQLDEMFRNDGNAIASKPASDALVASRVVDWSLDPWALGAYSHPSLGARRGDRRALAGPEFAGALFFRRGGDARGREPVPAGGDRDGGEGCEGGAGGREETRGGRDDEEKQTVK